MANEAKKNNEITNEELTNAPQTPFTESDLGIDFTDPYANKRDAEENDVEVERGESIVIFPTRVPLYRFLSKNSATGKVYNNIRTAWQQKVKRDGKETVMECEINFIAKSSGRYGKKNLYELINVIYGDADSVLLQVQRRELEMDGNKNVFWTPLITFTDDNLVTYSCPLAPSSDGDKAMWNLLLSILNKKGVINGYSPI